MRFITITLIVHAPDPVTGVGERHERPFISSAPTVMLSHVAALTTRIIGKGKDHAIKTGTAPAPATAAG